VARILVALGANIGNRRANLRAAVRDLAPEVRVRAVSALYASDPAGVTDQPPFFNAALLADTDLAPEAVLDQLQALERRLGRRPGIRWGPRPLDLDLLAYDDLAFDSARLVLPHPRIRERAFVLGPLADLDPERVLPGWRERVRAALARIDTSGLRRIAGPGWADPAAAGGP